MGEKKADRRKYTRFVIRETTKGRVSPIDEVSLVNIALGGVLVESAQVVRPGTFCNLELELEGKRISFRSRVVWSMVARQGVDVDGEAVMIYHTGLEFCELSPEAREVITDYLRSMLEQGKAVPSGNGMVIRPYKCENCAMSFDLADSEVRPVFTDPRKRPVRVGDMFYYDHRTCEGTVVCVSNDPSLPWSGD